MAYLHIPDNSLVFDTTEALAKVVSYVNKLNERILYLEQKIVQLEQRLNDEVKVKSEKYNRELTSMDCRANNPPIPTKNPDLVHEAFSGFKMPDIQTFFDG